MSTLPIAIGKYLVLEKLGEGATATVYKAFDPPEQREVAVKLFSSAVLQDKARGHLFRHLLVNEASLAGKLNHPQIVCIFDAVIGADESYIVMEYLPGGTLEAFTSSRKLLPIERLVEVIFKCTRALQYANQMGITHRDIKPANILLTSSGDNWDVKLSDFGAAMLVNGEETRTQVQGVGSPSFMSPQQVQDLPLNHQTDIYSLGVTMYQLLTGRLPFNANTNYSMVYQITHIDPPPPSTYRAEVPASIDQIVARAMQKTLEARYSSWEVFAQDLAQAFRNHQLAIKGKNVSEAEKFDTLRAMDFFRDFNDVELWEVLRFSRWDDVAANTQLMKDGETGEHFSFVVSGQVEVTKHGHNLSTLEPGDCFGEMAIISRDHHRRIADVTTRSQARIITIRAEALNHATEICRTHFYQAFLQILSARLAQANAWLAAP